MHINLLVIKADLVLFKGQGGRKGDANYHKQ